MIPAGCGGQARGGNQSENLVGGEGRTSINKIGVCGCSSLQRGLNSQLVPRATPELSKASLTPSTRPLSASGLVGWVESGRMKIGVCRHCFAEGPKRRGERRTHQTYPLRVEAVSNYPPIRQPRARATSHRAALSLGQRQVRLGREKPVDHRSRAHAQPPTPPASARGSPSFRPPGPRGGREAHSSSVGH